MRWLWLIVMGCGTTPEPGPPSQEAPEAAKADAHQGVNLDDPQACAACHGAIVQEWEQSMHARAHHDKDPIYGAMRALRMDKQGDKVAEKCAVCHTPRDVEEQDSAVAKVGVGCATCHLTAEVGEGLGVDALAFGDGSRVFGPSDLPEGRSPVHGTGEAPSHMKDGKSLCLACHDATSTPSGAPACTTGPEFAASASEETCVSCHMPKVDEPSGAVDPDGVHRRHIFRGPHRAWYQDDLSHLSEAVALSASFDGDTLAITLANRSGHGFPSGFPGRMALVAASGTDASGEEVWKAWGRDPMAERPDALLHKVYVDGEGNPTMPPFSKELERDTRLKPDEARVLRWEVPEAVVAAEVKLLFRLLPPKAAEALELADAPEAAPKTLTKVSIRR